MITGYVKGQGLAVSAPVVVSDTIDYLEARFVFLTRDWDDLEVWAHWSDGTAVYDFLLDDDGMITADQHLNLTAGEWKVHLTGHLFSGGAMRQRIATVPVTVNVRESGVTDGNPFPPLPATMEEQILARLAEIDRILEAGGGGTGGCANAVLYTPQDLDKDEQQTARNNIGAVGSVELGTAVGGAVTAARIRNALGYTPADADDLSEFEIRVNDIEKMAAMNPTIYDAQIIDNAFVLPVRLADLLAFTRRREVNVYAYNETHVLAVKLYPNSMGTGVMYGVQYVGEQMVPKTGTNCVVSLIEGDEPSTTKGVIQTVGLPDEVKTEIAEQAAGMIDTALLDLIGEVTE